MIDKHVSTTRNIHILFQEQVLGERNMKIKNKKII